MGLIKRFEPYMMPVAMAVGIVFFPWLSGLAPLTPYLIFVMLFLTYCKMDFSRIRLTRMHGLLLVIQAVGSVLVYWLLRPVHEVLAQGAMVCVLAPTATSAPVITGMLGGNVESLMAYSLLSNLAVIVGAPVFFSLVGSYQGVPFAVAFVAIARQIVLLLFLPLFIAFLLRRVAPGVTKWVAARASVSFYLWTAALIIVTARTVLFITEQGSESYRVELLLVGATCLIAAAQFCVGRMIGRRYADTVAGGQGLGQKNTVLAIWMSQTFLNPLASVGPGAYVLWQNIVNSWQVWRSRGR